MVNLNKEIRKFALENAYAHKGTAQVGPIIGKLISSDLISKKEIKKTVSKIKKIIKKVNKLSLEEQEKELEKTYPEFFEEEKDEQTLKELPNAKEGRVVTRIPPEPSKHTHIGHALSFLINYLYAQKYKGRCILRFEDTNPEKSEQRYVDSIKRDLSEYLDIEPDEVVYESDDLPEMYSYAEKLIKKNKAYVCTCPRDKLRRLRNEGEPCKCRSKCTLKKWKDMLNEKYEEGEATLRLKANISSDNYAMRDPVIFRICNTEHYRQGNKYKVWPLYDFAAAVEEELCGITHVLRSSEFGKMRIELQNWISEQLGFEKKTFIQYGRFNIAGAVTKGREIRKLIKEGKVSGWDDVSLVTLKALERRGIHPETFRRLAVKVGLSKTETKIDWSVLAAENRKILDPIAERYYFVEDPVKIEVLDAPSEEIKLRLHPEGGKGNRKLKISKSFFVSRKDAKSMKKGDVIRLKDCHKIKITKAGKEIKAKMAEDQSLSMKTSKIQWVPAENNVKTEVIMPDHEVKEGLAEKNVTDLNPGDIIQFTRFGFCRLDKKLKNKLMFVFGHK